MFTVADPNIAILLCAVTMAGWGSWANTQKLAGRDRWSFDLYYWDYAIGVALAGVIFWLALSGGTALANLEAASAASMGRALFSGALFNVANILLVVAIDAAGMSVAFPVGVGLALVIGTVANYVQAPKGSPALLFSGVALVCVAMVTSAVAQRIGKRGGNSTSLRGLLYAVVAGCMMGFFYPQLMRAISPDFHRAPIEAGYLTPYTALLLFGFGLLLSNLAVNTWFMRANGSTYRQYLAGSPRLHSLGLLGGAIWMVALTCNVIASAVAGPAIAYALGQGATLVAAIWGVFIWREFRGAPPLATRLVAVMFLAYAAGLFLIGRATLG